MKQDSYYPESAYIFRVVDSHWICISQKNAVLLCDFLRDHGFGDLPDYVEYALCNNHVYDMKYRHCGGQVTIYIKKL